MSSGLALHSEVPRSLNTHRITARVPYAVQFPHLPQPTTTPIDLTPQTAFVDTSSTPTPEDLFHSAAAHFVHGGIHPSWSSRPNPIDTMNEIGYSLLAKAIAGPLINPMGLPRNTTVDERALYDENGQFGSGCSRMFAQLALIYDRSALV